MEAKRNNVVKEQPQPLPVHEESDYLGQFLSILLEHYPGDANEPVEMAVAGYRLGLSHLSPHELELALYATLRLHQSSFRPVVGQILAYLHDYREMNSAQQLRSLPEKTELTKEQSAELLSMVRREAAKFAKKTSTEQDRGVVTITDEMRDKYEKQKRMILGDTA